MGGESGSFEGKNKLEAWLNFKEYLRERGLDTSEGQGAAGLHVIFPTNKRDAFRSMARNKDDTAWVLGYHLHS